jgi:hypothetical protein
VLADIAVRDPETFRRFASAPERRRPPKHGRHHFFRAPSEAPFLFP